MMDDVRQDNKNKVGRVSKWNRSTGWAGMDGDEAADGQLVLHPVLSISVTGSEMRWLVGCSDQQAKWCSVLEV